MMNIYVLNILDSHNGVSMCLAMYLVGAMAIDATKEPRVHATAANASTN
jgi:hypothetical protein